MPSLLFEAVSPEGRDAWRVQVFRRIPGQKRRVIRWLTVEGDVWPGDLAPGCEIRIDGETWKVNAIEGTKILARIKRTP